MNLYLKKAKYIYRRFRATTEYLPDYAYWHGCIFIHIPRCGGVALQRALFGNLGGGHSNYMRYKKIYKDYLSQLKVTSIVRNPFSRLLSAYFFLQNGGYNKRDEDWYRGNLLHLDGFEDFVLNWLDKERIWEYVHFYPQWYFLEGAQMDYLGRFEDIATAHQEIAKRVTFPKSRQISIQNTGINVANYKEYYTTEMSVKVAQVYDRDLSLYGYKF